MIGTEISPTLQAAIEAVIRQELGRFGVSEVEVIDSEDADGDPVILVNVHYRDPEAEPDFKVASGALTKLNDKLFELKEPRFAYLRHKVPEAMPESRGRR
ncbi:hypothetical protein AO398_20120 [Methylobacterium sp. GXS13]|jgi:hypothetical protein|uniref:hypothetical protein n=1 Tax=Methylobacterium sp. GXS13 TaxID=1730094 RepID=UPI00071BDD45|nr:hypothetical protein [Methylobacterium sp. GXS13]KST58794.1 hypothetical protein AO398_20120 [Methylobacterium sp. GXS13]